MQKRRIMAKKVNEESGGKLRKLREERLAVEKLAKTRFKGTFLSAKKKMPCALYQHIMARLSGMSGGAQL